MSGDNKYIKSLVEKTKRGNNVAFKELYNLNSGRVYAVALRLTADPEVSEDVCKKVFKVAWKNITGLRSDLPFTTWVKGITVYLSLDKLRTNESLSENKNNSSDIRVREKLKLAVKNKLDLVITSLPDLERAAFVLNNLENYTLSETADLLKVDERKVKSALQYAQSFISESFAESYIKEPIESRIKSLPIIIEPPESIWNAIFQKLQKQESENADVLENRTARSRKTKRESSRNHSVKKAEEEKKKGTVILSVIIPLIIIALISWFLLEK